jgi:hypothetical protein
MIGLILAAAAQGPVLLASNDEAQWRNFIRASLEGPPPAERASNARVRQLESVVRALRQDEVTRRLAGPSGL